jgi:hypothetical protein
MIDRSLSGARPHPPSPFAWALSIGDILALAGRLRKRHLCQNAATCATLLEAYRSPLMSEHVESEAVRSS